MTRRLSTFPPHRYPWHDPTDTGASALAAGSGAADHALVVAVGANASADVLAAKLAGIGGATPHPFAVTVTGVGVGHSAHVSRRGYLPATAVLRPGTRLRTTAALLDADRLAALDATEPNYHRVSVPTSAFPLASGDVPVEVGEFFLYFSRHGTLADRRTGDAIPFTTQGDAFSWARRSLGGPVADVFVGDAAEVCARLADPRVAADVAAAFRDAGLIAPLPLHLPVPGPRRGGVDA